MDTTDEGGKEGRWRRRILDTPLTEVMDGMRWADLV